MTAVRFDRVSKRFRIGEQNDSLGDLLAGGIRRLLRRERRGGRECFLALNEVSFEAAGGEAIGIIGPNGAGKSTALKLLAGIMRPDAGEVTSQGRKAALIEVGAGFHGDLTGRENIGLNGTLLGMSRGEIRGKLDSIVAFAGIERFLDTPVKRYSSGMYARLGFSIAAHVDPDVLLVDEVLSVGDAMFRVRCLERMRQLVRDGTCLVFVTHDLEQMRAICGRTLVLEHGEVSFDGTRSAAIAQYLKAMSRCLCVRPTDLIEKEGREGVQVERFGVRDGFGDEAVCIGSDHFVQIELDIRIAGGRKNVAVELNLRRAEGGDNTLSFNSARKGQTFTLSDGLHHVTLDVPSLPLRGGQYFWNVRVWDARTGSTLTDTPFQYPMVLDDGGRATGSLSLPHEWTVRPEKHVSPWSLQAAETAYLPGEHSETAHENLLVC